MLYAHVLAPFEHEFNIQTIVENTTTKISVLAIGSRIILIS